MPRMRRKADLPTKTCAACGRPFAWRKKWERVWGEVRYCSDRCRSEGRARSRDPVPESGGVTPRSRS
ncbi:DUF2256 domain-containing protein [Salinarimonas ramus]|uniref:DUF2256 domain-containing protein n=1 Tax=Salinarimonas ramus TaxID=690164 RepID=A0A917Q8S8_9HYPH|nr:DUF2256 domain-containing protein [Salinarimonas ramus]GGK36706.1 hypothetical protein GCM10011322_24630 [Salinarimonas ramus]